jgi:hypothetical protein
MDRTEGNDCRWLKYAFETPQKSDDWLLLVQNRNLVTVPTLGVISVHGTVLLRHADAIQIHPEHLDLFNNYLDHAYQTGLLPDREGFFRYCSDRCRFTGSNPMVISEPLERFHGRQHGLENTAGTDAEIFWRKLFRCERLRRSNLEPPIPLSPAWDFHDTLLIAASVVTNRVKGRGPRPRGYYLICPRPVRPADDEVKRCGREDHELGIKLKCGFLMIRSGPLGCFLRIPHRANGV